MKASNYTWVWTALLCAMILLDAGTTLWLFQAESSAILLWVARLFDLTLAQLMALKVAWSAPFIAFLHKWGYTPHATIGYGVIYGSGVALQYAMWLGII